ncbi:hypothetical protein N7486_000408 [Penicillium sp. IBT 16267x]|nr:hypothetical protein N7486_000408 [Penicillium sp. IBT 16267x]
MTDRFPDKYHDEIINMEEEKWGAHHHHHITHNEPAWNEVGIKFRIVQQSHTFSLQSGSIVWSSK